MVQVAQAWGEVPVARAQDEIALISRASESSSEWLDDVGVRGSASSSIHASTVLSDIDSVHDMTDQSSAAKAEIVVISMGKAPVVLGEEAHQKFESPLTAMAGWIRRRATSYLLACFLLIALAGAMPRSIALIIIERTVQLQSPMPAAFENFAAIWAPCKDPENTFTAFYQEGQLYRTIILTDHVFWLVGITLAYLGAIHVVFPVMPPDAMHCQEAQEAGLATCFRSVTRRFVCWAW